MRLRYQDHDRQEGDAPWTPLRTQRSTVVSYRWHRDISRENFQGTGALSVDTDPCARQPIAVREPTGAPWQAGVPAGLDCIDC